MNKQIEYLKDQNKQANEFIVDIARLLKIDVDSVGFDGIQLTFDDFKEALESIEKCKNIGVPINQLLKSEMIKKGFNQKGLSKAINKSETALSQIFKGAYNANPSTIEAICDVLNIEIKYYAEEKQP